MLTDHRQFYIRMKIRFRFYMVYYTAPKVSQPAHQDPTIHCLYCSRALITRFRNFLSVSKDERLTIREHWVSGVG